MATFREITFAVSDTSDVSEIIPFGFWLYFSRKNKAYYTLGLFFLLSGSIKLATLVTAILHIYNMPAYHLLAFLEVSFVYSFYRRLTQRRVQFRFIGLLLILYAANTLVQDIHQTFNSNTWTLTTLLILYMGLDYFYRIYLQEDDDTPLEKRPDFVITAAWLIYAAGSLFTYLMGTDILSGTPDGFFKNAWFFQCVSNIIKNAMICYGFYLTKLTCRK
jgi:hypothetical protein